MKTRQLPIGGLYTMEHRTDGFYFQRMQSDDWHGPYDYRELFDVLAEELKAEATYLYTLLHKEAPR